MAASFVLPSAISPGAGVGRKGKAEPCLSGVCSCPSHIPHSLSSPWGQLRWPKEAQVVGGKVSIISKEPEEALKSGKGDVVPLWGTCFRHAHLPRTSASHIFHLQVVAVGHAAPSKLSSGWGGQILKAGLRRS